MKSCFIPSISFLDRYTLCPGRHPILKEHVLWLVSHSILFTMSVRSESVNQCTSSLADFWRATSVKFSKYNYKLAQCSYPWNNIILYHRIISFTSFAINNSQLGDKTLHYPPSIAACCCLFFVYPARALAILFLVVTLVFFLGCSVKHG